LAGLDEIISSWSKGGSLWVVLALALLLGVRHATDPDHLVAVSTLVATEPGRPARRAWSLGLAWGLGHATTLILLGVPVVLAGSRLPDALQTAAEALVGVVIMALALRLLLRWHRGGFHVHEHAHDGVAHRHVHAHEGVERSHGHSHALARSGSQAFGIGLAHGVGGSAAVTVLLLASIDSRTEALLALGIFAVGTAASMAALSLSLGFALGRGPLRTGLNRLAPALGTASFAFGAWYALGALAL
jgi:ABC-type nickel/cobalt efflux system permease component RcnA